MTSMPMTLPFIFLLFLTFACGDDETPTVARGPAPDGEVLIASELLFQYPLAEAQTAIAARPELYPAGANGNAVNFYRIRYATPRPDGARVPVSALVAVPVGTGEVDLISIQQQTPQRETSRPSAATTIFDLDEPLTLEQSISGAAVIFSDQIGYGASRGEPHPYQHAYTYGSTGFDGLRALRELLTELGLTVSDRLFLTGYSAGGDATLAVQRHIEANTDWPVTLSAPAGGAYDKVAVARAIAGTTGNVDLTALYVWIFQTYDRIYELNRPWTDYLSPEAARLVRGKLEDGAGWLALGLPTNVRELLNEDFRRAILNGSDADFLGALVANDLTDWTPRHPVHFYHGMADRDVPPVGARNAATRLGDSNELVRLTEFTNADHSRAYVEYLRAVRAEINRLRE